MSEHDIASKFRKQLDKQWTVVMGDNITVLPPSNSKFVQRIEGVQIEHACDHCHGTGRVHEEWVDYDTHEDRVYDGDCHKCNGTGKGQVETVTLILPVGVKL